MKNKLIAYAIASMAILLFSECHQPPPPKPGGPIPYDTAKAQIHVLPADSARILIREFRTAKERLRKIVERTQNNVDTILQLPAAESFNRDAFAALLNAPGAQGIRIYYGRGSRGEVRLILVPTDANGKDIITELVTADPDVKRDAAIHVPGIQSATAGARRIQKQVMENGQRCDPPPCMASELYSF
ncbi:hypothetical protein [uncultured Chitinophaga sp.]|jgi:hypothetical protein|uniref:hypothetical protein n=1 Tax=uncultured Chitinophaga sp. TaxID=339340 RepID=UPI002615C750|nr:hypothetical protein [uncultured Chitinophaga sp.]